MTTDTQHSPTNEQPKQPLPFGARLKSAREAMGIDRKEAAQKLNLSEKVILMMEKDRYPIDLPVTFIKGYLRSYGKLLQIPDYEVKKATDPIKPKHTPNLGVASTKNFEPMATNNYFMHSFTFIILLTIVALVTMWWYTHSNQLNNAIALANEQTQSTSTNSTPESAAPPGVATPPLTNATEKDEGQVSDQTNSTTQATTTDSTSDTSKTNDASGSQATKNAAVAQQKNKAEEDEDDNIKEKVKAKNNNADNDNDSDYSDND